MVALVSLAACAPRTLAERVDRARGGPVGALVRDASTEVRAAFPGQWTWRTVFRAPDGFAWSIVTSHEPNHYLFDGQAVRAFIGNEMVGVDVDPAAPLRLHARIVASTFLDPRALPGATVRERDSTTLEVTWPDLPEPVILRVNDRGLVVEAEGPTQLPFAASGRIRLEFDDFRRTGRWVLPWRTTFSVGGEIVAVEQAVALCPHRLPDAVAPLTMPDRLPQCGPVLESEADDY